MNDPGCNIESGCQTTPGPAQADSPKQELLRAAASPSSEARSRITPRRTVLNYWVDLSLLLIFLALTFAMGVTQFVFPNGPIAFDYTLWGGSFSDWRTIQFGCFAAFGLCVVLHLMLHWNWLCCVTNTHVRNRPPGRDDGSRTLLGVGVLVAILHILGIGLLIALSTIQSPTNSQSSPTKHAAIVTPSRFTNQC